MRISAKFDKHDIWIGVYWETGQAYVCVLPCLPIKLTRKAWLPKKWPPPGNLPGDTAEGGEPLTDTPTEPVNPPEDPDSPPTGPPDE